MKNYIIKLAIKKLLTDETLGVYEVRCCLNLSPLRGEACIQKIVWTDETQVSEVQSAFWRSPLP
jgi:hypothetical protein